MLSIFRKVRKSLMLRLSDHPVARYLLYAVGEIVLVVIGILIALQINNWNEEKKDIALEAQYLTNVLTDLKEEQELLFTLENREGEISNFAMKATEILQENQNSIQMDSLSSWLNKLANTVTFSIKDPSYEDLKSTGHLRLFRNVDLKNQIVRFYEAAAELEKIIDKNNTWIEDQCGRYIRENRAGFYIDKLGKTRNVKLGDPEIFYTLVNQINTRYRTAEKTSSRIHNLGLMINELIYEVEKEISESGANDNIPVN